MALSCATEPSAVEGGAVALGRLTQEAARAAATDLGAAEATCAGLPDRSQQDLCRLAAAMATDHHEPALDGLCAAIRTAPWDLECRYHAVELQQVSLDPLAYTRLCLASVGDIGPSCVLHGLDRGMRACQGQVDPHVPGRCWFRPDALEAQMAALDAATGGRERGELSRREEDLAALAARGGGRWLGEGEPPWW